MINERLAKRYFPGEDPIGQIIFNPEIMPGKTERGPDIAWEVVGIVADEKIGTLNDGSSAVVYATYDQSPVYFANVIVRADVDPTSLERWHRSPQFLRPSLSLLPSFRRDGLQE